MRSIFVIFCFLFLNSCIDNIVLAREINNTLTPRASELIIPISVPFADRLIDINKMPFRECTFGHVYNFKKNNSLFLITGLIRHENSVIINLFNEEYRSLC